MRMTSMKAIIVGLLILAAPSAAFARGGDTHKPARPVAQPCGVASGGLPDPAVTQACLARRYIPPAPQKGP